MNESQWVEQLCPIPNPYTPGMGFDYGQGSCLMSQTDLQQYSREHPVDPDQIWTVVDSDGDLYLSQGAHWINSLGYIVTEKLPRLPVTDDICLDD